MNDCCFELYGDPRYLHVLTHSFPTRRSSDLIQRPLLHPRPRGTADATAGDRPALDLACRGRPFSPSDRRGREQVDHQLLHPPRSEEHTSELQSLMRISYAVFCLKKKKLYIIKDKTSRKSTTTTQ